MTVTKDRSTSATRSKQRKVAIKIDKSEAVSMNNTQKINKVDKVVTQGEKQELVHCDGIDLTYDPGDELDFEDVDLVEEDLEVDQVDQPEITDQSQYLADREKNKEVPIRHKSNSENCSIEELMNNPQLQQVFNKMLDVHLVQERAKLLGECSRSTVVSDFIPNDNKVVTPNKLTQETVNNVELNTNQNRVNVIKSPSNTTIYVPALQRMCSQNK